MFREVFDRFRREIWVYRAVLSHPRTPRVARWLLEAAIAYTLSSIDPDPRFHPVLGHLDDAIIVPSLMLAAVTLIPVDVLECRAEAAGSRGA